LSELSTLFAEYGVDAFLESTRLLVVLLDKEETLLSWNPAFDSFRRIHPHERHLRDFLSTGQELFGQLFSTTLNKRIRAKGEMEFTGETRPENFVCLFVPMPTQRVLLIAEPIALLTELEAVTADLQKTKRILTIKETELKAVIAQADEVSHTDSLTFLPNRKQIVGDLQREVIFSDHYGTPLTISMLDIDHFKKINDTYGHTTGDAVLRNLAAELRSHIRHPDTIGRYGGEEFLIVLPHSPLKAAKEQAERLCRHVRDFVIESGGNHLNVTVSLGLAQYKIHNEDWEAFLSRADAALYQAKNKGRNQWVAAEE
jgi:diguanylate cyclase (GGDEF)-like protein